MNLKFIESRKAGYKVVEFRGVGVADKEIIDSKGEGGERTTHRAIREFFIFTDGCSYVYLGRAAKHTHVRQVKRFLCPIL